MGITRHTFLVRVCVRIQYNAPYTTSIFPVVYIENNLSGTPLMIPLHQSKCTAYICIWPLKIKYCTEN